MKTNSFTAFTTSFIILIAFTFTAAAQNFDNIAASFKTGDATGLAKHFEATVEITIKNAGTSYSKSQAEMVLKSFFSAHQPKTFAISHQGTSPEGSKYFIGILSTSTGIYRTYVYAKINNGALVIQEIRFEEQ